MFIVKSKVLRHLGNLWLFSEVNYVLAYLLITTTPFLLFHETLVSFDYLYHITMYKTFPLLNVNPSNLHYNI